MLRIHNTLSRTKEVFEPIEAGKVRLYVCGMTVYDYCHIGHARMLVVFDVVQRWLRASGYQVTYVRNITDIDDKIIRRAVDNGETIRSLTDRFIAAMHEDLDALGVQRPDHEPRATEYVPQMLAMIDLLERNDYAYRAVHHVAGEAPSVEGDGAARDVNFAVARFANYGRLSGKAIDELLDGARVAVDDGKLDPRDFVLWKAAKADEPQEVKWPSRYGAGRPGWHIECSAMSTSLLGSTLDIHGGGADLQFPHHENELAQSEGALFHERPGRFVNTWMHNGFVTIDDEKMSKSLGNFFTVRDVLKKFDAEVIRFFILRSHYRSPLDYSDSGLEEARTSLLRLYNALSDGTSAAVPLAVPAPAIPGGPPVPATSIDRDDPTERRFADALDDDFNTPIAVAVLFELAAEVNRTGDAAVEARLLKLAGLIGLLEKAPAEVRQHALRGNQSRSTGLSDGDIDQRINERSTAKKSRDFATADRIRAELAAAGIVLEDGPAGTTWRRG